MDNAAQKDDLILPFQIEGLDVRGRVLRMGASFDRIMMNHAYPDAVTALLGEVVALAMLFGSNLKFTGKLIVQVQTNGPVRLLVADVATPDKVRAMARFDEEKVAKCIAEGKTTPSDFLGQGQMVMTIDQGPNMQRYQGIVALSGQSLSEAADDYFRQSEQIPTLFKLAVGSEMQSAGKRAWRLGGLMVQFLPQQAERMAQPEFHPGDAPQSHSNADIAIDDAWNEAQALAQTVQDVELLDRMLAPEHLLFRLFHERGARVFPALPVAAHCTCNETRIADLIRSFSKAERQEMTENGKITVTCDFCSNSYGFDPALFD